jgi:3-oxoacyl-[acyl-carrier protein] reductase
VKRSACIVGSDGGIGHAIVDRLGRDGWSPVLRLDLGGEIAIDVRDERSVRRAFEAVRGRSARLDLLVVACGIVDKAATTGLTLDRWNEVLAVNLTGPFLCCREAVGLMADGGRIVLISSLSARTGGGVTGAAYATSKGGLETYCRSLARELAPRRITVNCVQPGAVDTAMFASNDPDSRDAMIAATPLRRTARPEEIAGTVAFLATAEAAFITGAAVAVNGGLRMD